MSVLRLEELSAPALDALDREPDARGRRREPPRAARPAPARRRRLPRRPPLRRGGRRAHRRAAPRMDGRPHADAPSGELHLRGGGHDRRAPASRPRRGRRLRAGARPGGVPVHPGIERARRARPPGRPRGGGGDRVAPPSASRWPRSRATWRGSSSAGDTSRASRRRSGGRSPPDERRAFADDAHGGWWETSLMLLLRPELVDAGYRDLPPARYPLLQPGPPELPAARRRPGLRGRPGARRPRVREGDPRGPRDRGHGAGRGAARRPARGPPSPLAVPAGPVPADRLLAAWPAPSSRPAWAASGSPGRSGRRRRPRRSRAARVRRSASPSEKGAPPR